MFKCLPLSYSNNVIHFSLLYSCDASILAGFKVVRVLAKLDLYLKLPFFVGGVLLALLQLV